MIDSHKKIKAKGAQGVTPIVAGIAGVIAGGAAVAAAVIMSDKKNQKKVGDALVGAKEKVVQKFGEVVHDVKQKIDAKV